MRTTKFMLINVCLLCLSIGHFNAVAQKASAGFKNLPPEADPIKVGNFLVNRFIATPRMNAGKPITQKIVIYPEVCTWYGSLGFAKISKNKALTDRLINHFEPFFGKDSVIIPQALNVDYSVFGAIPLELYMQTAKEKYLSMGQKFADEQWTMPANKSRISPAQYQFFDEGYTWQTRLWVDDMFMITMLQLQAYRATNDSKYLNRAAKEAVMYLDSLQQPNGLFFHAPDVPYFWGRGCGWFAVGMAELLRTLPKQHADRARIMKGYQIMMASLLNFQKSNGMWLQLLDDPNSWEETSCTGMFTYAMITGVKEGWLDKKKFTPAARKAWIALVGYINEDGDVKEVCEGTNKKNDHQYYLDRKRNIGDLHGQAPVLWCVTALLR